MNRPPNSSLVRPPRAKRPGTAQPRAKHALICGPATRLLACALFLLGTALVPSACGTDGGSSGSASVTTAMAEDMLTATYPEAEAGVLAVATINMFTDPHRLLSEAQPVGEPQPGEGGASSIRANVSGEDLIGLSLPADLLARYGESPLGAVT